jgi:hypothetical protein
LKVLTDFHHADLYHSLYLLFEKRLGYELYFPHGLDWYDNKYWIYNNQYDTVQQFLTDVMLFNQMEHRGVNYRPITLQEFKESDFDIVISSIKEHEIPFYNLIKDHMPHAKYIRQEGNDQTKINFNVCKNIMCSMKEAYDNIYIPSGLINKIFYHQEFDISKFYYKPYLNDKKIIRNFVHYLPHEKEPYKLWKELKRLLPGYKFIMHGCGGDDGVAIIKNMAQMFQDSMFTYHMRHFIRGPGYNSYYSMACGRPMITALNKWTKKVDDGIFEDNVTCIDIINENRTSIWNLKRLLNHFWSD